MMTTSKIIWMGTLILIGSILIYTEITSVITQGRTVNRAYYWKTSINKELPLGSSEQAIKEWGLGRNLHLEFSPNRNSYEANVEQVPVVGMSFPCSEWNIIVDIYVGMDGKSSKQDVHMVGSCI